MQLLASACASVLAYHCLEKLERLYKRVAGERYMFDRLKGSFQYQTQ
jgi:hypothetical protein